MWMAFTEDGTPISGSNHEDDPGMCMLYLMRLYPAEVGRDFVDWVDMRDSRAETAVRALFYHLEATALKEEYLQYVATCAKEVGFYNILYSDFSIRTDETEGDE